MKQKTKKKEKNRQKKKQKKLILKNVMCMLFILISVMLASVGGCYFYELDIYHSVRSLVLGMTAALMVIFSYQAGRISGRFSFDDGEHPGRFLVFYLGGILCSLVFTQLPVTGWMFLFFYIALARVSDGITGICAGTSLLMLTTIFSQQVSLPSFLVYFFSGMVGVALFAYQEGEFRIAIPLCLSLGVQVLLTFSCELLIQNKKLVWESALIPAANVVMNGILLCIFLQYYINKVARKERNLYLMVNDPEYEVMKMMREDSEEDYYRAIHTAYLTERIAGELGLDVMAAKCAAYYKHLGEEWTDYPFPQHACELLGQFQNNGKKLKDKEAVIVWICDEAIATVQQMKKQGINKSEEFVRRIDQLFKKRFTIEAFADTDITLSNLRFIRKRLNEEGMYYEFMMR